jgi:hypothetical protein
MGDDLSVLDIAWFIYEHRLSLAGYPLSPKSHAFRDLVSVHFTRGRWDLPPKSTVCTILSNSGTGTARWSVFIMRSTWRCASTRDVKQARQQRSSIRRAQRVRSIATSPDHAIGSHATTMIALPKMMAAKMTASTSDTIGFS